MGVMIPNKVARFFGPRCKAVCGRWNSCFYRFDLRHAISGKHETLVSGNHAA